LYLQRNKNFLFYRFNLSIAFLYIDLLGWPENEELKNGLQIVKKLKIERYCKEGGGDKINTKL